MHTRLHITLLTLTAMQAADMTAAQERAPLQPVPLTAVSFEDEFWAPRLRTVREHTLRHCFQQCEQTGRLANFDKAAGQLAGRYEGWFFNDSDVYKVLEAAAYVLAKQYDPQLDRYVDDIIARIAAAQQPDGYLNAYFILNPDQKRWGNTKDMHELYCAGHLLEAGIAHFQATGKRSLLDVALRFIDCIDAVFGPDRNPHVPGHEEIELALLRLYRLTPDEKYLNLARHFIEQRGRPAGRELYGEYHQDHAPVREHTRIVGHAVRALYLYCAVADLAAITGDEGYLRALDRVWRDAVYRKMYITGGVGPAAHNEGFTTAYDLPNDSAYCETCAAVGLALWNHRLNLLHADAKYADVFERVLYNGLLAGISLDGRQFFYVNPLASRGNHHRQPWYSCACCPPNILRFLAALEQYVYAHSDDAIYVNLYAASSATVTLRDARPVRLTQQTRYPWDGHVRLTVTPDEPLAFDLCLRIPAWCDRPTLTVAGQPVSPVETSRGYARIHRTWKPGDLVELDLPMPVQRMQAHPRVEADLGRVALQRGPVVFCLEAADNSDDLHNIALPRDAELKTEYRPDLLGGVMTIRGRGLAAIAAPPAGWAHDLYEPACAARPVTFLAIPYYAWDNRTPGAMVVWLPESLALVERPPVAWLEPSASHTHAADTLSALHDRIEPADSSGRSLPRFSWWPRRGTTEWVQYAFDHPRAVSSVEVYWFDDSSRGGECRAPTAWRLLYRHNDEWREVPNPSEYGVMLDMYNRVTFDPVLTDGLRIEVQLQEKRSGGILEWIVGLAEQERP